MNKGNLNKLVTNYPVELTEEEISNLSGTLAPVIAACGGGGGGSEGKIYTGIGFVNVNNTTNQIGLTNEANTKLNQDIPTKVSDLSDSANYQTVAGMTNYLTTATYEADSATFLTQTSASQNLAPISVTADVETLKAASGDFSEYYQKTETSSKSQLSAKFNQYAKQADLITTISLINGKQDALTFGYDENNAISSIDGHEIAGTGGITGDYYSASNPSGFITSSVSELDNFYSKTDTSSKTEIANAIKDFVDTDLLETTSGDLKTWVSTNYYDKTETSSKTELQTKFDSLLDYNVTAAAGIEVTTATDVGIKTFGISMTAQPVVTDTRLSGYNGIAAEPDGNVSGLWDVGLTQDMLNTINGKLDSTVAAQTYQPKGDYVSVTDIADMATKTWVGDQGYITTIPSEYITETELAGYNYATTALLDTISSKIESDIPTTVAQLTDSGNYYTKSETSGATELSTEFGKYALKSEIPTVPTKVSDLTDSANYYKTTETSSKNELSTEFAKYLTTAQYNTDSAIFALKSDLNDLVSSASVTTNDNYVMTTTGWKVLTLPGGGMTQVYHDTTLTGDGNANDNQLGVVWSALSGNTINSAKSADVAMYYYDTVDNMTLGISTAINGIYNQLDNCLLTGDIMPDNGISGNYISQAQAFELGLTQTAYNAVTSVSSKLDTTAAAQTYLTKSSADNDYAPISITASVNTLTAASAGWNNKVDKPTSLNDKYLVLRTDSNGNVSGWCDFQDQSYSKSEALGTFVATANIDTTTLSGDGKSVSTKLGVKTDVIATKDYVSGNYLPTSGGTVSGQLVVSGGSNFDTQFLKIIRENVNGHARLGLGQYGALALKADDNNSHTTQINVSPNTTNDQLVQVQHNGNQVGFLIPAVTATSTDGLTNDGILHIILES